MTTFFVPGLPVAKGSAKAFVIKGTNRAIVTQTNRDKQKPWQALIGLLACHNNVPLVVDKPVTISMIFQMPRPKKHYRANGELREDAPDAHIIKPDVDKLVRCVFDALTTIAWKDDCQAQIAMATKCYADESGVWITISKGEAQ